MTLGHPRVLIHFIIPKHKRLDQTLVADDTLSRLVVDVWSRWSDEFVSVLLKWNRLSHGVGDHTTRDFA